MLLLEQARYVPCPLCGEVHGLRIHAVLWRKVRSPEVGENIEVTVISIICGRAKEAGGQYSKRILPPFVIPYCQIGRQGVLAYLGQFPDGKIVYRLGNELLGARDIRTLRRHVALGLATIAMAGLELASLLCAVPAHATLPEARLGESSGQYLQELGEQMDLAGRRARGKPASSMPSIVYLHLVSVFERSPAPLATPLSCVLKATVFHDTS
jgi:hypothetical protein